MNPPEEYVEFLDKFMSMDVMGVKVEGASRTDAACLTMVAYLKELPIEVRSLPKKIIYLSRTDK